MEMGKVEVSFKELVLYKLQEKEVLPEQGKLISGAEVLQKAVSCFYDECALTDRFRRDIYAGILEATVEGCRNARKAFNAKVEEVKREKENAAQREVEVLLEKVDAFLNANMATCMLEDNGKMEQLIIRVCIDDGSIKLERYLRMKDMPTWNRRILLGLYAGMNLKSADGKVDRLLERAFLRWCSPQAADNDADRDVPSSGSCFVNHVYNVGSLNAIYRKTNYRPINETSVNMHIDRIIRAGAGAGSL